MDNMRTEMKAVLLEKPCNAEDLKISKIPIPIVKSGWVLVKIKAFGINRAEILTRNGHSPSVKLPRVIGIECVGIVEDPSDSDFNKGETVFSIMNGMGRDFDGSYAEYSLIPSNQVYKIDFNLLSSLKNFPKECYGDIENSEFLKGAKIAAYPELYYTAYGSLFKSLKLESKETLFIRGGTSSVALAAMQLSKALNVKIIATTRNPSKEAFLKENGVDIVLIEDEFLEKNLFKYYPNGVDKILELIGTSTLKSSLKLIKKSGIVCMTGCLGGWILNNFEPLDDIISESYLTSFNSTFVDKNTLEEMFEFIKNNNISPNISKIFTFDKISEAHKYLESNKSNGKVVVVIN